MDGVVRYRGDLLATLGGTDLPSPTCASPSCVTSYLARIRVKEDGGVTRQLLCRFPKAIPGTQSGSIPADLGIDGVDGIVAVPHLETTFGNKLTIIPLGAFDQR